VFLFACRGSRCCCTSLPLFVFPLRAFVLQPADWLDLRWRTAKRYKESRSTRPDPSTSTASQLHDTLYWSLDMGGLQHLFALLTRRLPPPYEALHAALGPGLAAPSSAPTAGEQRAVLVAACARECTASPFNRLLAAAFLEQEEEHEDSQSAHPWQQTPAAPEPRQQPFGLVERRAGRRIEVTLMVDALEPRNWWLRVSMWSPFGAPDVRVALGCDEREHHCLQKHCSGGMVRRVDVVFSASINEVIALVWPALGFSPEPDKRLADVLVDLVADYLVGARRSVVLDRPVVWEPEDIRSSCELLEVLLALLSTPISSCAVPPPFSL